MLWYYYFAVILTFVNLVLFILTFEGKKVNCLLLLLNLLMLVSNLGYLAKAAATGMSEAILSMKICYVGGCFIPPVLLYTICCVGNIKVKNWIKAASYLFSFIVFAFVLTIGYNDLYYKYTYLTSYKGTTVLGFQETPVVALFYIEMYGNLFAEIMILCYSCIKRNFISRKSAFIIIMMEIINLLLFVKAGVQKSQIEIMPLMYVLDGWFLLYLQRHVMMYNLEDSINSSIGEKGTYGYILFDKQKRYMGCNASFENIYPDIVKIKIDSSGESLPDGVLLIDYLKKFESGESSVFSLSRNNRHYFCTVEWVLHKEKKIGFTIEFRDDTDKHNYLKLLSNHKEELEIQVKLKTEHILDIQNKMILGMANMVENRDENTGGHIRRTSGIIKILIDTIITNNLFKVDEEFCEDLIKAAPMHDLGKISIDDRILRKPGKLNADEFAVIKTHAAKSAELVKEILQDVEEDHFVTVATNVARHHHEKWDGTGYPDNLKGDEIPFEARIMAVADVYDALVSKRCYKEAMSFEDASKIMLESMGNHFDPKLKDVFLLSQKRLENYYYYER